MPVWLLLAPRDYLSTFVKLGTIGLLGIGIVVLHPTLHMPAFTRFVDGTGPVFAGQYFSVRIHHHCVRGDQRISFSDFERNNSEANRARDGDSHGGLWRDDGRVGGSGDGNDRGLRVAAGSVFCNQQSGGNCRAESGRGDRNDYLIGAFP